MNDIWMYWETPAGGTRPPYLDLCLKTIEKHRGAWRLRYLDEVTVGQFLPDLRPEVAGPSLNHKSDYIRPRLVHHHGGLWLDADVIALRPLGDLADMLGDREAAFYGRHESDLSANCFIGRSGSPILKRWMELQDAVIDSGDPVQWNGFGKHALVEAASGSEYRMLPHERIAPLRWQHWKRLRSNWRSPKPYLSSDPILYMLYNHFLHDAFGDMNEAEILDSNMLISKLFRLALGAESSEELLL